MNIKGNYTVKVLWFFNSLTKKFEEQLPEETQEVINGLRENPNTVAKTFEDLNPQDTGLQEFPLVTNGSAMDWSPELTTLISQQASWTVYEAKKDLQAMLAAMPGGDALGATAKEAEPTKQALTAAPSAVPGGPAASSGNINAAEALPAPKQD
jgi:hypothetical protein